MLIYGLTRVRNEAEIIDQTLDAWGEICDQIFVFDDASTDDTAKICKKYSKVAGIISVPEWIPGPASEGMQRQALYEFAQSYKVQPEWYCCFDADEIPEIRRADIGQCSADGIICQMIDLYRTPRPGLWCGPEYRDTLIFWRPECGAKFKEGIVREPIGITNLESFGRIMHGGKAISEERWEAKCSFYETYFPEPYKSKWAARHGKFIHTESDFGRPLVKFEDLDSAELGPCLYSYANTADKPITC